MDASCVDLLGDSTWLRSATLLHVRGLGFSSTGLHSASFGRRAPFLDDSEQLLDLDCHSGSDICSLPCRAGLALSGRCKKRDAYWHLCVWRSFNSHSSQLHNNGVWLPVDIESSFSIRKSDASLEPKSGLKVAIPYLTKHLKEAMCILNTYML